jgi:hypothetical protein
MFPPELNFNLSMFIIFLGQAALIKLFKQPAYPFYLSTVDLLPVLL